MAANSDSQPLWVGNSNASVFLKRARADLQVALQPIVDINTGETIAYEALVRGHAKLGFASIDAMFSHAFEVGMLVEFEECLIAKALSLYAQVRSENWCLLFLNIDGRTLGQRGSMSDRIDRLLSKLKLAASDLCVELSERNQVLTAHRLAEEVAALRSAGYAVALDDFGVGDSGLKTLYESNPNFLKIDRFFISSIQSDRRKRLMVSAVVDLAHSMGARVIAEGVETVSELHACRELRCDFVQGYLVDTPCTEVARLKTQYPVIKLNSERRQQRVSADAIRNGLVPLRALSSKASLVEVFELFKSYPEQSIIPIVDAGGVPQGIIREKDLKPFVYSSYGRELLQNPFIGIGLKDFVRPIPMTDINSQIEPLLDLVTNKSEDGVLITEGIRYKGVLLAGALVHLANEMRLEAASDRNPLTRLPGNAAVKEFLDTLASDSAHEYVGCYIDIDNFKPFNDKYGFRAGDRALLLLAQLLKKLQADANVFVGHIGGDDFFAGATGTGAHLLLSQVMRIQRAFADEVSALYTLEDREAGYIVSKDREGRPRRFPLLSCTAAAVEVAAGASVKDGEQLANLLAEMKLRAKQSSVSFLKQAIVALDDDDVSAERTAA